MHFLLVKLINGIITALSKKIVMSYLNTAKSRQRGGGRRFILRPGEHERRESGNSWASSDPAAEIVSVHDPVSPSISIELYVPLLLPSPQSSERFELW